MEMDEISRRINIEHQASLHKSFPVQLEPQIPTMNKKLIIVVASPGWLSLEQNPNIPTTHKDMAKALIDSCKAGASVVHMHARQEGGTPTEEPEVTKKILDMVFKECPDAITSTHIIYDRTKRGIDSFRGIVDPLTEFGVKYIQAAPLLMRGSFKPTQVVWDTDTVRSIVSYLEKKDVKPEFQAYDTYGVKHLKEAVIDNGLLKNKPCWLNLHLGKHHAVPIDVDPWAHLMLINWIYMTRSMIKDDLVLGVYVGGRNWLPLTLIAIALGIDVVRVGIEDCLWVYPHKDEIIKSDAEMVKKIVAIANVLNREVANPAEARKILGL